jgi:hypothetical protein
MQNLARSDFVPMLETLKVDALLFLNLAVGAVQHVDLEGLCRVSESQVFE